MAEAEAATALLRSNESKTMLKMYLPLATIVAIKMLSLPRQYYQTSERPRNTTYHMYCIRIRPLD